MALDWMPRDNELKDHMLHTDVHWGKDEDAPCVVYEKRPLTDPKGNVREGLYVAWIRLNNPKQYNSYTTEMVKGVIAGFENLNADPNDPGRGFNTFFSDHEYFKHIELG